MADREEERGEARVRQRVRLVVIGHRLGIRQEGLMEDKLKEKEGGEGKGWLSSTEEEVKVTRG